MNKDVKIYVAGHNGMVGSAIVRNLIKEGYQYLVFRTSAELDLRDQRAVNDFFAVEKPEWVFLAAAKVGGIMANKTYKAEFIYDNLMIQTNVIHAAFESGVKKLLFLGSSCIYPKDSEIPITEDRLMSGPLEPTNDAYAVAKIAGIHMCRAYREQYGCNFIAAMPCNLYGPNDNYDPDSSHVLAALIKKIHDAKHKNLEEVVIWGTGRPRREFLHVDDLADACLFLMNKYDGNGIVNVGRGKSISILDLAKMIAKITGYRGSLTFDTTKPDGVFEKTLDTAVLDGFGWKAGIGLEEGIKLTWQAYTED